MIMVDALSLAFSKLEQANFIDTWIALIKPAR